MEDDKTFSHKLSSGTLPQPEYVSLPQVSIHRQKQQTPNEDLSTLKITNCNRKQQRRKSQQMQHTGQLVSQESEVITTGAKSLQSCPTVRPHRRQRTRLPHPWDSPGKNTGVGCHFLLQCMKVKSESENTTRLLRPWDFPGKSTGVGCHCLLPIAI